MTPTSNPWSQKVLSAAGGTGIGSALGLFLTWLLGVTIWHAPFTAEAQGDAIAAVPTPVSGLLVAGLAVAGALLLGYRATDPLRIDPTQVPPAITEAGDEDGDDLAVAESPEDYAPQRAADASSVTNL